MHVEENASVYEFFSFVNQVLLVSVNSYPGFLLVDQSPSSGDVSDLLKAKINHESNEE